MLCSWHTAVCTQMVKFCCVPFFSHRKQFDISYFSEMTQKYRLKPNDILLEPSPFHIDHSIMIFVWYFCGYVGSFNCPVWIYGCIFSQPLMSSNYAAYHDMMLSDKLYPYKLPKVDNKYVFRQLTHWGREVHIYVSKLTIIGSDNGWSLGRHQAIIWTNAEILLIRILGTEFHCMTYRVYSLYRLLIQFRYAYHVFFKIKAYIVVIMMIRKRYYLMLLF